MSTNADRGPLQPKAVLRGHKAQVHVAAFVWNNARLVTGDADGFVVVWDLTIMRARAVWRAHSAAILGVAAWGADRLITHGRDNRLVVWKLSAQEEASLSTVLPLDPHSGDRPQPWVLHILEINTMNFCSFSSCPSASDPTELLIAVPNTLASEAVDIFHLPSQRRIHTVQLGEKNGMVMALSLFPLDDHLVLVAAYENGLAVVARLPPQGGRWDVAYRTQVHAQPVLSLDVVPDRTCFLTSGADAIIAKHPIPRPTSAAAVRSAPSYRETEAPAADTAPRRNPGPSLLSAALAAAPQPQQQQQQQQQRTTSVEAQPLKVVNTKHSGQQSLRVRSDGRVFATAGWDARVRVYSVRTLKEVAVLKWHQAGCYAVAFADVVDSPGRSSGPGGEALPNQGEDEGGNDERGEVAATGQDVAVDTRTGGPILVPKLVDKTVRERRLEQVRTAHWIAAGSKDGKVSLWDVF